MHFQALSIPGVGHVGTLNEKAHTRHIDHCELSSRMARLEIWPDGQLVQFTCGSPVGSEYEEHRGKRQACLSFTHRSRAAMLRTCAMLNKEKCVGALFVTLTYHLPDSWESGGPEQWKRHLEEFYRRLSRKWKAASYIWKLEPQERGAPHFHLMVFGVKFLPHQWVAQTWHDIVNGKNLDYAHLIAGTSCEAMRSFRGVMSYCGKHYMGKECGGFGYPVGRFWGIMGRKFLPLSERAYQDTSTYLGIALRRVARGYFKSLGLRKRKMSRGFRIYSQNPAQWVRVLKWAEDRADKIVLDGLRAEKCPF